MAEDKGIDKMLDGDDKSVMGGLKFTHVSLFKDLLSSSYVDHDGNTVEIFDDDRIADTWKIMYSFVKQSILYIHANRKMVDGTYTGIGRGGGNLRLELLTLYLALNKDYQFNLTDLFEYLDIYITDESRKKRTKEAICGMLNVHPYRLEEIKEKSISEVFNELQSLDLEKKRRYEG